MLNYGRLSLCWNHYPVVAASLVNKFLSHDIWYIMISINKSKVIIIYYASLVLRYGFLVFSHDLRHTSLANKSDNMKNITLI
jgi:uncharacterized membrane protein